MGSMIRLGHMPSDTWLLCLPLDHIGGISVLLRCLWYATCVELSLPFSAPLVRARLETGDVHLISLVPAMLHKLLDVDPHVPLTSNLRAALVGGSACPEALWQRALEAQIPVALSWGMTEAGSQIATSFVADPKMDIKPLSFCEVTTQNGHLVVHGSGFDHAMVTNDLGSVQDGCITIHGRSDDIIISGGENIHPLPIQRVLEQCPAVRSAYVMGLDDPCMGQTVLAAIVVQPDQTVDDVRLWCKEHLPKTQIPKHVVMCSELPMNRLGKVDRAALTRMIVRGECRDTET
jgi:O-succinylbenzoic acid--CoA ligase